MDSVLLASFVDLKTPRNILDLGAGCGVIGLILARRLPKSRVTLVEIQEEMCALCMRNIEANRLGGRVSAMHEDIRRLVLAGMDVVVTNPPFRRPGTGRLAKGGAASARHELDLPLDELLSAAARALKPRGRLYMVYHPERLADVVDAMREVRIEPKRLRFVHGRRGMESRVMLVEAVRDGKPGLKVEPPLFVFGEGSDEYTTEVAQMYQF